MIAPRLPLVHGAAALLLFTLLAVRPSAQDETTSVLNQRINVSNQEESVHIGKLETNNYHHEENNYQPTQNTHVTVNVGKMKERNKMRKHRLPTDEEMSMKRRILEVYEQAKAEVLHSAAAHANPARPATFHHLEHLGRILSALNPKYIATKRVWRAAFADPLNPSLEVVPPERDLEKIYENMPHASEPETLELLADGAHPPVTEQLDHLASKFQATVSWDRSFVDELLEIPDSEVSPRQLAFKNLLQCLAYPDSCSRTPDRGNSDFVPQLVAHPQTSALERGPPRERLVRMPFADDSANERFIPQQEDEYPGEEPPRLVRQVTPHLQQQHQQQPQQEVEFQYGTKPRRFTPAPGRRRFARGPREPASDGYEAWLQHYPAAPPDGYTAQQEPELAPPQGYQQTPIAGRGPPREPANNESARRLIYRYAPDYASRKLG